LKRDVRVEITIPGGTSVFAVNEIQEKFSISGVEWNYVFMSSTIRSFFPKKFCQNMTIVNELDSESLVKDFFLVSAALFKKKIKIIEPKDLAPCGSNFLLQKICDYF
jgi:hypothetical protein